MEPREMPRTALLGRLVLEEVAAAAALVEDGVAVGVVVVVAEAAMLLDRVEVGVAEVEEDEMVFAPKTVWSINICVAFCQLFALALNMQRMSSEFPPANTTSPSASFATA
jgi:hypothetical protein